MASVDSDEGNNRGSSLLFWSVVAAGIVVVVFGVVFASRFGQDITLSPTPTKDRPVSDVPIRLLDSSETFRITDFDNDIVVVNFWASWCLSCRSEHSALNRAATEFGDSGVTFVGILYQDDPEAGAAFLDELGRGSPYVYGLDQGSRVAIEFGVLGLPETFFVDRNGIVVGKVSGPVDSFVLENTLLTLMAGGAVENVTTAEVENR